MTTEANPESVTSASMATLREGGFTRRIARGELPMPDDDVLADRYEQADAALRRAGMQWYEVSTWATGRAARCRHDELYWAGESPVAGSELLDDDDRALEAVMLGLRLRDGLPLTRLSAAGRLHAADAVVRGLLEPLAHESGRAVLTDRGRLLADAVVGELTDQVPGSGAGRRHHGHS